MISLYLVFGVLRLVIASIGEANSVLIRLYNVYVLRLAHFTKLALLIMFSSHWNAHYY